MADPRHTAPAATTPGAADDARVWVGRTAAHRYTGHNGRATPVPIAMAGVDGCFSPTELLRLALAGCAGLSAEHVLTRRLGEHADVRIAVDADHDRTERRFAGLTSTMILDLSGLDPRAREQLSTVVTRAVHRYCTVGRTLEHGAPVPITFRAPA
jgi:uncharacterized OsmC-like protein